MGYTDTFSNCCVFKSSLELPIKADVRGQKFMSKRIIKFETFDYLRVKYVSPFSDIS